jgi:hypothetical protein
MRTFIFTLFALLSLAFTSCMKHASDYEPPYGVEVNTWTFFDGTKHHVGVFLNNPVLNTTAQPNGTFVLDMTGTERSSGKLITMAISLADIELSARTYQSGISGSTDATAFYYSGSAGSRDAIYSSANVDPGAVMNYSITYYDAVKNLATLTFSGQVFDTNGNLVKITKGKMTAHIDRK